ncbi:MAG: hypothetical protein G8345_14085, partial [Magnetococcales bacterium]|nr:hypothetical protein [Magnetococcales bacterium]
NVARHGEAVTSGVDKPMVVNVTRQGEAVTSGVDKPMEVNVTRQGSAVTVSPADSPLVVNISRLKQGTTSGPDQPLVVNLSRLKQYTTKGLDRPLEVNLSRLKQSVSNPPPTMPRNDQLVIESVQVVQVTPLTGAGTNPFNFQDVANRIGNGLPDTSTAGTITSPLYGNTAGFGVSTNPPYVQANNSPNGDMNIGLDNPTTAYVYGGPNSQITQPVVRPVNFSYEFPINAYQNLVIVFNNGTLTLQLYNVYVTPNRVSIGSVRRLN